MLRLLCPPSTAAGCCSRSLPRLRRLQWCSSLRSAHPRRLTRPASLPSSTMGAAAGSGRTEAGPTTAAAAAAAAGATGGAAAAAAEATGGAAAAAAAPGSGGVSRPLLAGMWRRRPRQRRPCPSLLHQSPAGGGAAPAPARRRGAARRRSSCGRRPHRVWPSTASGSSRPRRRPRLSPRGRSVESGGSRARLQRQRRRMS